MRAVDTNVLVRLAVGDEPREEAAARVFVQAGAWVSHLVLVEATWVLSSVYDLGPAEIASAVEVLLKHQHLTLQDAEVVEGALALFRERPALGFSDCLVLEVARRAGHVPLGTFDRGLAQVEGAERITQRPGRS
ncbi:MAG: type II toxin-antitoxin system VapC family toxin [Solirubrobacterales bacterium]